MNPAPKEAFRRFGITTAGLVVFGIVFGVICYSWKPTLEANPRHPIGPIVFVGFLAASAGYIALIWYVNGKMRSRCPQCHKTTATMVNKPSDDIYLECKECGYSEKTGWRVAS